MAKKLVIFAHPYLEYSPSDLELSLIYKNRNDVVFRDIYEEYPDFYINAFRERKTLNECSILIFHFPMIWFGMPPLLKLWIDEVFDVKWLNEKESNPLSGSSAYIISTVGGKEMTYSREDNYTAELYTITLRECLKTNNVKIKEFICIYNSGKLSADSMIFYKEKIKKIIDEK